LATATGFAGAFAEGAEKVDVLFVDADFEKTEPEPDDLEEEKLELDLEKELLLLRAIISDCVRTRPQHNKARTHFFIIRTPFLKMNVCVYFFERSQYYT
jgi:hypothetical protein